MKGIYFKGLNELRGIAALAVLFHHIEQYKYRAGTVSLYDTCAAKWIGGLGKYGVYTFFVLSGFLITYLLFVEKAKNGKIDVWLFYCRRALRVWPVYYIIVLVSFAFVPWLAQNLPFLRGEAEYYSRTQVLVSEPWFPLVLFLLFLPNLALRLCRPIAGAAQAWSVGVEEQFYLLWPHILNQFSGRRLAGVFFGIAFLYPLLPEIGQIIDPSFGKICTKLVKIFPVHLMAIGAIGAFAFYMKKLPEFVSSSIFFVSSAALLVCFTIAKVSPIIFSIGVILFILSLVQQKGRVNLNNAPLSKVGRISYGLYMYHPLVMFLSFGLVHHYTNASGVIYNLLVYSAVVVGSLIASVISYRYLEKPFIMRKLNRYSVIPSGELSK
jgi:peptidoglycan/LPS O-acetylase OafA/YrhL